jgi:MSHA biogenesis protein MshG
MAMSAPFDRLLVWRDPVARSGPENMAIDELLLEVADFYDTEVEYDLKKLGDSIEPILISFIGGLVLILALGVFLPIWDLNTAANG